MKTIAGKNRFETSELRFTPSNRWVEKTKKGIRIIARIALAAVSVFAVWSAWVIGKGIVQDNNLKIHHLLIAFILLRWFLRRGLITKAIIILIVIAILG